MTLFLVQHGRAKSKEEDTARPLSADGLKATEKMAGWLVSAGVSVDQIRHSGKKRAEETALVFEKHISPGKGVTAVAGLGPNDDVQPIAADLKDIQDSLMLVGHLPFLSRLAGLLLTGDPEKEVIRFQNSGVLCLQENEGRWRINWLAVPDPAGK